MIKSKKPGKKLSGFFCELISFFVFTRFISPNQKHIYYSIFLSNYLRLGNIKSNKIRVKQPIFVYVFILNVFQI